jgi:cell wall-associated NlpC family hydrolase
MQGIRIKFFILVSILMLKSFNSQAQESDMSDTLRAELPDSLQFSDTVKFKNPKQVDDIINFAKKFLGTPYRYAGSTPSGFDCSGFIYYVMGNFGFSLTRTSYGLAEFGRTVRLSEIRPGDLMFFKGRNVNSSQIGHVGMVIDVGPGMIKFIHSSTSRGVVIDNFYTSKYYVPRFIKAKRLDYGEEEQK